MHSSRGQCISSIIVLTARQDSTAAQQLRRHRRTHTRTHQEASAVSPAGDSGRTRNCGCLGEGAEDRGNMDPGPPWNDDEESENCTTRKQEKPKQLEGQQETKSKEEGASTEMGGRQQSHRGGRTYHQQEGGEGKPHPQEGRKGAVVVCVSPRGW